MELYIIRHGQTEWNKDKLLQGSTDIQLNEEGRRLARISGEAIRDIPIDRIFSSPLQRAYETASLFRGERDIPIQIDERLRELCFGVYEGQNMDNLKADREGYFQYFFDAPEKYRAPIGGESLEALCERAADFMEKEILPLEKTCRRVLIAGHGALNKALMMYVKKHKLSEFWSGGLQKNCNVIILKLENGSFSIVDETHIFY